MGIDLGLLFVFACGYLGLLFVIAWCADNGWLSPRIVKSPAVYSLSLGVYATSWTYYGSVGLADRSGLAFLTIYLGLTGAFILGPYVLKPILRLCREKQLTSIADLLAFRYSGRATGPMVTLFLLLGILPYISLQIHAFTESVQILSRQVPPVLLALVFCIFITVFAVLFGARHLTPRDKHQGLVVAIAFESAVKLVALLIAGLFVVTQVFDSPLAMNRWAQSQPGMLEDLHRPGASGLWSTLLLLSFCAAFTLPRQYHMTFVENQSPKHLNTAYWLFPLYLLLLNLPIIPILFAGRHLSLTTSPDFYVLGLTLTLGKEWLAILVFLGGLSASSAMIIVTTLALTSMSVNHLLLPATLTKQPSVNFYKNLLWIKRVVIAAIIAAGYAFYIVIELNEGLASLGLISFVASAQLFPGILGLLFWRRATQLGFILGLLGGAVTWFILLILPLLSSEPTPFASLTVHTDIWTLSTVATLSVNGILFIVASLFSKPTLREMAAAEAVHDQDNLAPQGTRLARSVLHYRYALQQTLGNKVAQEELERALEETDIDISETRRAELRVLHDQLENNLSGLVGPTLAREILHRPITSDEQKLAISSDVRLLERRLQTSREQMKGLTKQLDDLRQYLQDVLKQLPLGVCSISSNKRIYIWNSAMQAMTGIAERDAYDRPIEHLEAPWGSVLSDFAQSTDNHQFRCRVVLSENVASVNLHKADIGLAQGHPDSFSGQVIIMEDRTKLDTLETELAHSERLASVGRLAAGVAHEIGNPLTGIASIAQNLHYDVQDENDKPYIIEQTDDILTQVGRINTIVRSLLTFSHADTVTQGQHEVINIKERIKEAVRLVRLSPETKHLTFDVFIPDDLQVLGDQNLLMQVFVNLVNNACDASPTHGTIRITASFTQHEISIETIDEGTGVPHAIREQIFEPFFTTKPVGQGTGLGLSLAYSIINNHNGRLRVGDSTTGTRMVVTLPRYQLNTE